MTSLVTDWYKNKKKFIDWFGGQLIFEYGPVEFHLDTEKKQDLVKEFLEQAGNYLDDDEFENLSSFILKNMSSFFDNIVSCDDNPIKKGMKLSKAFKYFISDKETLTKVQQIASMYIQKDKISGTLCLSVHPLDFLSLSENTYNWRSCHSLDGDYRAGNLSYMCDASTICCYIKGDKMEKLPNFPESVPWNSKKWRMLIYFDEYKDYCFLGRQYPYELEGIMPLIKDIILPGDYNNFVNFQEKHIPNLGWLNKKYIALNTATNGILLFDIRDVIEDSETHLHYNDLLYSTVYTPYYTSNINIKIQHNKPPKIKVGHDVKCLCCGERKIDAGEGLMVCSRCATDLNLDLPEDYIVCSCCGETFPQDDASYTADGDAICPICMDSGDYAACACCGEVLSVEDMVYSNKFDLYYCNYCFEDIAKEEYEYNKVHGLED